jgi:hypothetical protein
MNGTSDDVTGNFIKSLLLRPAPEESTPCQSKIKESRSPF